MTNDRSGPEVLDAADAHILTAIRDVHARLDPTPSDLTERIELALTVHVLHAEVAELVKGATVATRGVDAERTETITFAHGALSLMVNIGSGPGSRARIDGWVTSGGAEVKVVSSGSTVTAVADAHGRFVLDEVPRGLAYFVIRVASAHGERPPVATPTIDL